MATTSEFSMNFEILPTNPSDVNRTDLFYTNFNIPDKSYLWIFDYIDIFNLEVDYANSFDESYDRKGNGGFFFGDGGFFFQ